MGGAPLPTLIDELSARLRSDDEPAARHAFPQSATERPRQPARVGLSGGVAGEPFAFPSRDERSEHHTTHVCCTADSDIAVHPVPIVAQ